jgi:hypothetical protein
MSAVAAVVVVVGLWGVAGLCPLRLGNSGVAIHTKHHRSCQYPPGNSVGVFAYVRACVYMYVCEGGYERVCVCVCVCGVRGLVCVCESE